MDSLLSLVLAIASSYFGAKVMKQNNKSWIEGALWGLFLNVFGLMIIYFRIKNTKSKNSHSPYETKIVIESKKIASTSQKRKDSINETNKGYKKPLVLGDSGGKIYVLNCAHEIRVRTKLTGFIGKEVWCDVCNAIRQVTSRPDSTYNRS